MTGVSSLEHVLLTGGPADHGLIADVPAKAPEHVVPFATGVPKPLRGCVFSRTKERDDFGLAIFAFEGRRPWSL